MKSFLCVGLAAVLAYDVPASADKYHVGVTNFTFTGYAAAAARSAKTVIESRLAASSRFDIVERSRLSDILEEVAFQQSGVTETSSAALLGQQANIDLLLFGDAARLPEGGYTVTMRVVDVATGRVLHAQQEMLPHNPSIHKRVLEHFARGFLAVALALYPAEMVFMEGGRFTMGRNDGYPEEGPAQEVKVASFYLDRTEVSRAAFAAFAEETGRSFDGDEAPELPATGVSWQQAHDYCDWAERRLPTEVEWEYAARGSAGRLYAWGNEEPDHRRARFATAEPVSVDELRGGTSPDGVYHLSGNVSEWVEDGWRPRHDAEMTSEYRVIRGGAFSQGIATLRTTARAFHNPVKGASHIGFRCARTAVSRSGN
ncbi:MAG: SUMF1/EgtB/PvdO family nonheme iron enzyme [Candidatus Latescibacterota bacterium]|nr:SUMF1/EgtB/PvdO family nonheme iron enzyme [Candidatus Latescibacterota bacterium]